MPVSYLTATGSVKCAFNAQSLCLLGGWFDVEGSVGSFEWVLGVD